MNRIYFGDNLPILQKMPSESVDLIYIDPPFNTGKTQKRTTIRTIRSENGDRKGFQGNTYKTLKLGTKAYQDTFDSIYYIDGFLRPRLIEVFRLLKPHGSLYFHIDYREVHYCKILLDEIFGRDCFLNEIIWAYDFGGRSRSKWPAKHDNILFYVKDPRNYIFNVSEIDREKYMAPGLVGPEKAKAKKLPTDTWWFTYVGMNGDAGWVYDPIEGLRITDTWWHTIVGTNSKERIGYPTQKPRRIIDRIIKASSLPGNVVMDFFAGSGTVGDSCLKLGRGFILVDNNPMAMEVMAQRFSGVDNIEWINFDPKPFQTKNKSLKETANEEKGFPRLSSDFVMLAATASSLQKDENKEKQSEVWKNSPFEWLLQQPARRKASLARQMITSWCASKGLSTDKSKESSETLVINGSRIAMKFSTLWVTGVYKFQQIRQGGYDYVLCLGISPFDAHCWVFERKHALKHATLQHKGAKGGEYWIAIDPLHPEDWTQGCGGVLDQALQILRGLNKK
jgi:site-specific DNA-methyltransferase (adenine-specific)